MRRYYIIVAQLSIAKNVRRLVEVFLNLRIVHCQLLAELFAFVAERTHTKVMEDLWT